MLLAVTKKHFILFITFLSIFTSQAYAANKIEGIRVWPAPESTRVVFDLSAKPEYKYFTLTKPQRLVIDFANSKSSVSLNGLLKDDKRIKVVRTSGTKKDGSTRLVLELAADYQLSLFPLAPAGSYGDRLVLDIYDKDTEATVVKREPVVSQRDIVIAIVAGHGGEDPGSIGARGTYEKRVTLSIAKKLERLINNRAGLKAVMIRTGDYYVNHNRKIELARKNKADLLISIHADAFTSSKPHGASVLVQSTRRANSEFTRWIANRQKESELLGGAGETIKKTTDKNLAFTLADMKKEHTMGSSYTFAEHVIQQLKKVTKMHKSKPEGLSLAVLKSSDIPSVLIETGFISNPQEERNLTSSTHQQKLARAIYTAVDSYFSNNPPDGSLYASTRLHQHKIRRGESLSTIAQRYKVSVTSLKSKNNLKSNVIKVGQILTIPRAE
ncbi:N-acetylmuramoyl-L-alanine amidase [Pseudocolwellia sp. AS88]|uniref:N-acetylmuramoyl-L-alanine amidase n=1 Tax=Pseudocolwellia sp. AS88 TaxID=3063958 RepID=UPI0026F347F0|nr:N-acetylmuramoyl-L-alanine amidase [Pseudocolwellia sp. AS88]MDO7084078.1 N-acetylmuramoyl-L-alanine amidase [Pseudocolwellia sp. AS88]